MNRNRLLRAIAIDRDGAIRQAVVTVEDNLRRNGIFRIEQSDRALTCLMKSDFDPDLRKRGRVGGAVEPVRPRREGIGRALSSVFTCEGRVMPIDLEALLEQLDDLKL